MLFLLLLLNFIASKYKLPALSRVSYSLFSTWISRHFNGTRYIDTPCPRVLLMEVRKNRASESEYRSIFPERPIVRAINNS